MTAGGLPIVTPGMRIGLFGGSFNPAHEGHRLVALECLKRLGLDKIWIMVSPGNPLKDHAELAPLQTRVAEAVKLMDDPHLEVTSFEAEHGFTYTWETLHFMTEAHPGTQFVWIMGADSLRNFDRWERWEDIARMLPIAVYDRPPSGATATSGKAAIALEPFRLREADAKTLPGRQPPVWVYLHGVVSTASSTAIRQARGKTLPHR